MGASRDTVANIMHSTPTADRELSRELAMAPTMPQHFAANLKRAVEAQDLNGSMKVVFDVVENLYEAIGTATQAVREETIDLMAGLTAWQGDCSRQHRKKCLEFRSDKLSFPGPRPTDVQLLAHLSTRELENSLWPSKSPPRGHSTGVWPLPATKKAESSAWTKTSSFESTAPARIWTNR